MSRVVKLRAWAPALPTRPGPGRGRRVRCVGWALLARFLALLLLILAGPPPARTPRANTDPGEPLHHPGPGGDPAGDPRRVALRHHPGRRAAPADGPRWRRQDLRRASWPRRRSPGRNGPTSSSASQVDGHPRGPGSRVGRDQPRWRHHASAVKPLLIEFAATACWRPAGTASGRGRGPICRAWARPSSCSTPANPWRLRGTCDLDAADGQNPPPGAPQKLMRLPDRARACRRPARRRVHHSRRGARQHRVRRPQSAVADRLVAFAAVLLGVALMVLVRRTNASDGPGRLPARLNRRSNAARSPGTRPCETQLRRRVAVLGPDHAGTRAAHRRAGTPGPASGAGAAKNRKTLRPHRLGRTGVQAGRRAPAHRTAKRRCSARSQGSTINAR